MLRKGVVKNITSMIAILLAGGLVATTIGGPLYDAMDEGYSEIQQFLGISDRTELSDEGDYRARQELAAIAHYTWDRAHSCGQVSKVIENGGYDPLQETSYGSEPPCSGQSGTLIASFWSNILGDTGNDMEGKFSRIEFEVKDRIVLDTSKTYGVHEDWELNRIQNPAADNANAPKESFRPWAISIDGESFLDKINKECSDANYDVTASFDNGYAWPIVFSVPTIDESRYTFRGESLTWSGAENVRDKDPFCSDLASITGNARGYLYNQRSKWNGKEGSTEVVLCPGDEGYLQVNKGTPDNEGEYTSNTDEFYWPYIQITEVNGSKKCDTSAPSIPEEANAAGSTLNFKADLKEQEGRQNSISSVKSFKLRNPARANCRLSLTEHDGVDILGRSETGFIDYKPGTTLGKRGEPFPGLNSDSVVNSELEKESNPLQLGGYGITGLGTDGFYSILRSTGLKGDSIKAEDAPLLNAVNGKSLEMYGDLLCSTQQDWNSPRWVACDESAQKYLGDENTLTVRYLEGGNKVLETFSCEMESGKWISKNKEEIGRPDTCALNNQCGAGQVCSSQGFCVSTGVCEPVNKPGSTEENVDIVVVGDGYNSLGSLQNDVEELVDREAENQGLMSLDPFQSNSGLFNTWAVEPQGEIPKIYEGAYRVNVSASGYEDVSVGIRIPSESARRLTVLLTEDGSAPLSLEEIPYSGPTRNAADLLDPSQGTPRNVHRAELEVEVFVPSEITRSTANLGGAEVEVETVDIGSGEISATATGTTNAGGTQAFTLDTDQGNLNLDRGAVQSMASQCRVEDVDEVVAVSREEARSYAFSPREPTSGDTSATEANVFIGEEIEDVDNARDDYRTFAHEFGHAFAGLQDEYIYPANRSGMPNCAKTHEEAEDWWGQLAEENSEVDYFSGCYNKTNVRPHKNSLMRSHWTNDFGPVNERRISEVIQAYKQGELS